MRKQAQLCAQIQDVISISLSADFDDLHLQNLNVVSVQPFPDISKVQVTLSPTTPLEGNVLELEKRLQRASAFLRGEIAATINRKRTPTLVFQIIESSWEQVLKISI